MDVSTAIALVQRHDEYVEFCKEYGDKGYTNPVNGILFANWNNVPKFIANALERRGFELEWSDEWVIAYETNKAYRTSPDSYSWQPYFYMTEGGDIIGGDEIEEKDSSAQEEYIDHLTNNPRACNMFDIDFTAYGFVKLDETFETGFHQGMNDDPKKVFTKYSPEYDVIFDARNGQSQFYTEWTVWLRKKETEENDSE